MGISSLTVALMKSRQFRKGLTTMLFAACLVLAASPAAWGQSLDEAAQQAARQHDAKVLSAQTVQEGGRRVHVIKLLTRDGVVKTVRVPVREG
jgi:hypothetical protein